MRRFIGGALMVAVLATSCGDDSGDSAEPPAPSSAAVTATSTTTSSSTTTTTTTTTTEAPLTDEEQIIAVVERFFEIAIEANNPPDPGSALWDEVATPEFAEGLRQNSQTHLESGAGIRRGGSEQSVLLSFRVLVLEAEFAAVEFCVFDEGVLYDLETGEVRQEAGNTFWMQADAVRTDSWRLATTRIVEEFEERDECVASLS